MNHYSFVVCILGYQFIDRFASAAAAAAIRCLKALCC
jgi:hypothetical protein